MGFRFDCYGFPIGECNVLEASWQYANLRVDPKTGRRMNLCPKCAEAFDREDQRPRLRIVKEKNRD